MSVKIQASVIAGEGKWVMSTPIGGSITVIVLVYSALLTPKYYHRNG